MSNLENFINKIHDTSKSVPFFTANECVVMLYPSLNNMINEKKNKSKGIAFQAHVDADLIKEALKKVKPKDAGIYDIKLKKATHDLIRERKEIVPFRKRVDVEEVINEGVKTIKIPVDIEKFDGQDVSFKLKKIGLKEAYKDFYEFYGKAKEGKLFILEDVYPKKYYSKITEDQFMVIPNE